MARNKVFIPRKKKLVKIQPVQKKVDKEEVEVYLKKIREMLIYLYLTSDIQEYIVTDIISVLKKMDIYEFSLKNKVNQLQKLVESITKEVTDRCNSDEKIYFGDISDSFKEDLYGFLAGLYSRIEFTSETKEIHNMGIKYDFSWDLSNYFGLEQEVIDMLDFEAEKQMMEGRFKGVYQGELYFKNETIDVRGSWYYQRYEQ